MNARTDWFEHLRRTFTARAAVGIDASYTLRFDDAPPYALEVRHNTLVIHDGVVEPATVNVLFDTFESHCRIMRGGLDPMEAFLTGRFRSDGHIVLVMRMLQLFVPQYASTGPEELR